MSNIYQISQELLSIFEELEENGGELTPELEEKLIITQNTFKDKIKSYTDVIKSLNNDITSIKEETLRLKELKESKEKTIEHIKSIIVKAIDEFGESTKTGGKFIDFGTGKVSIRNTESIEIDEDSVNRFVNRYITGLKWFETNNQLQIGIVDGKDLLNFANSITSDEEDTDVLEFTLDDLKNLKAKINTDIDLNSLLTSVDGFALAKALIKYGYFNIEAKADKISIKKEAKENHNMPRYATLVQNKSVIIK